MLKISLSTVQSTIWKWRMAQVQTHHDMVTACNDRLSKGGALQKRNNSGGARDQKLDWKTCEQNNS